MKLVFLLQGAVGSYHSTNDGPNPFVGKFLREEIAALSQDEALENARERVTRFLAENADLAPPSAPGGWESTYRFTLTQVIWSLQFMPEREGQSTIEAVPAHGKETVCV